MIKLNLLFIAFGLSLVIHGIFIFQFKESEKIKEIYVVDLSTHREFKPIEIPQKETKQTKNELNKDYFSNSNKETPTYVSNEH